MVNIQDRLVELDAVLEYMDDSDWVKIPDKVIFYIKENKSKDYTWTYDESKSLEDQDIHQDTFSLLSVISYKYIATEEEKEQMKAIFQENTDLLNEKYSADNLFKQPEKDVEDISSTEIVSEETVSNSESLTVVKSESIFDKIKSFFKNLFKK